MSKVSSMHWELANAARWHLRKLLTTHSVEPGAVKVNGRVEHYHRQGGYRDISVIACCKPLLIDLAEHLRVEASRTDRGVRVFIDIAGSMRSKDEYILEVSIFPGAHIMSKSLAEVAGQ